MKAHPRRERRDVFISYAREDVRFVHRLEDRLKAAGKTVYVDYHDVPQWSEDWQRDLYAQIDAADTFVIVLSPDSAGSRNVDREVEHAIAAHKRIRPLLVRSLEGAPTRDELRRPQWLAFRDPAAFDASFAQLLAVLETDVDWVEHHTRLLLEATDWSERGEDRSLLLGRTDLRAAETWLATQAGKEPPPSDLQARFILASRAGSTRRQRIVFSSVVTALVVTAALAVFALIQRSEAIRQRDEARSGELAALSTTRLGTDPETSIRLALQAVDAQRTDQAEMALQDAVAQSHVRLGFQPPGGAPSAILDSAVTRDGRYAVTGHLDRLGRVWDLRTGQVVGTLQGHTGQVDDVDVSPDGRLAVSSSSTNSSDHKDDSARVWELPSGRLVRRLRHDSDGVGSVLFSPDGRRVVTTTDADAFDPATVWDVRSGKRVTGLGGEGEERLPAWSPDGRLIATDSSGVTVWDATTGRALRRFPVGGDFPEELAFSPDGRRLAVAGDGVAFIATLGAAKLVRLPGRHDLFDSLHSVRFCPDGTCVVTASGDRTARVWSLGGRERATLRGHTANVTSASLSRDGRYVVTTSEDSTARVWSRHSGAELAVLRGHDGEVTGAHFLGAGNRVFTTSVDGTGRVWDPGVIVLPGDRDVLQDATFSPDGRGVATAGFDGTKLWTAGGRLRARLEGPEASTHETVTYSPDGQRLLIEQDTVSLFTAAGKRLRWFGFDLDYPAFSPDSKLVAVGDVGAIALLDARTGRDFGKLKVDRRTAVFKPVFSPDGQLIAAPGARTGAHVWDLRSRRRTHDLNAPEFIDTVAFSPDGRQLATSGDSAKALRVWDLGTRQNVVLDTYPTGVREMAYSPDGKLIASVAPGERRVHVHDADTRERISVLVHDTQTSHAGFSPDSRLLITVSDQATALLWEARTGRLVSTLTDHTDTVETARFSPDGRRTITSSADGTAVIRTCDECLGFEKLVALARGRLTPLSAGQ